MLEIILFSFYRKILIPLIWFILSIISHIQPNKKWSHFYFDRKNKTFKIKNLNTQKKLHTQRPIWVHAASGEIEYARPLLRKLKEQYPNIPLLVTSTSRSSKNILEGLNEIDIWGPSPWDSPKEIQDFLNKWNPRALLISRTDLWPEMLYQCQIRNIPRILFSASFQFSTESNFLQSIKLWLLKKLTTVFAVSEQDVANLKIRGIKNVLYCGDTRFDQVFFRLNNQKQLKIELKPQEQDFIFIAGSTWPEDEMQIVQALSKCKVRAIIAPHEVDEDHLKSLELLLTNQNISSQRYSQCKEWQKDSVLIIDKIGILAEIYTWGNVAFVGGSFKKQVHSVMEPLAAGLFTLVGPYHSNNREAIDFQSISVASHSLVTQVNHANEMSDLLNKLKLITDNTVKTKIQIEVKKKQGATEVLIAYLNKNIDLT